MNIVKAFDIILAAVNNQPCVYVARQSNECLSEVLWNMLRFSKVCFVRDFACDPLPFNLNHHLTNHLKGNTCGFSCLTRLMPRLSRFQLKWLQACFIQGTSSAHRKDWTKPRYALHPKLYSLGKTILKQDTIAENCKFIYQLMDHHDT